MKSLLQITYPFPPNSTAGAVRSERFARYLPEFSWNVDVVTIKPRSDLFEDSSRLNIFGKNVRVHFTSTLDPCLWARDKKPENRLLRLLRSLVMEIFSFPDHMLLWVPFAVREGLIIHESAPIDAIYTTSPPHSTHLAGLLLSKLLRKPWVADFRDPWTQNAYIEKGGIKNILLRIEKFLEKRVYKNASAILANTKANRNNLINAFPWLKEDKILYLPNGWETFPESLFSSPGSNLFTIVHAGTFYPRFKPYALFHAIAAWRDGKQPSNIPPLAKDIRIVLLGSRDDETRRIVNELRIEDWVEIKPWVALEEARKMMCQADLLWATLGTGKESSTYVPSKIFEYISAKKPILGFFHEGEAADIIRNTNTGIVFSTDEPVPIIEFLYNKMCMKNKSPGAIYFPNEQVVSTYSAKNIAEKLSNVLMSLK
jgi:glycosyltransferase involved in cell wall biosynthesis